MLKEQIDRDLVEAMKARDEEKVSTLRMLKSAVKNAEIQKGELADQDVMQLVQSQIKSRRDSIELFKHGGREELAQKEENEIEILASYLPEQLSDDKIREIVQSAISETGASEIKDMGKVMGKVIPELKGKADGSKVSQIVKEELSK